MQNVSRLPARSMRSRVTREEWQARVDLAACYRLVALYGMPDVMANHISSRGPGEDNAFLINAYGLLYEKITASIQPVPKRVLEATYLNYQPQTRRPCGVMEWPALLRKLDRLDASYKD